MKNWIVLGTLLLSGASAMSQGTGLSRRPQCLVRVLPRGAAPMTQSRSGAAVAEPDSAGALQAFLEHALAVAGRGDDRKLAVLVKEMEIPNFREWFRETYGPVGAVFAEAYGAKLEEQDLARAHMLRATAGWMKQAKTKTVFVRRVNDGPYPGDPFETNAIRNLRRPVSIFFASHDASGAPTRNPIGYFVYVDGSFRWQSAFLEDAVTHRIIVDGGH